MGYTKTNWQSGDVITAEKLNHAEQGIADGSFLDLYYQSGTEPCPIYYDPEMTELFATAWDSWETYAEAKAEVLRVKEIVDGYAGIRMHPMRNASDEVSFDAHYVIGIEGAYNDSDQTCGFALIAMAFLNGDYSAEFDHFTLVDYHHED